MTIETDPLFILIPQEDSPAHELERFIADVLYRAGAWDLPRTSDGISFWRVVERSPILVRIGGRIYEISQEVYSFWLDLERDFENVLKKFRADTGALGLSGRLGTADVLTPSTVRLAIFLSGAFFLSSKN